MELTTSVHVQETGQSGTSVPDKSFAAPPVSPLVSLEVMDMIIFILAQLLQLIVAGFGIFSNIVNVIVYIKMGFSDTSSITLTALSLADLATECYLFLMAASLHGSYDHAESIFPVTVTVVYLLSTAAFAMMGYGSWITAIISVERCLCIVFPMKVKSIFTVQRITILVIIVFILQMSSIIPTYATMTVAYVQSPITNRSSLAVIQSEYGRYIETITTFAAFTIPSVICLSIVVLCTIFLVVKLNQSAIWRKSTSNATSKQDRSMSTKENRVVRTVVMICAIYIFFFAPNVFTFTTMAAYPNFAYSDPYLGYFLNHRELRTRQRTTAPRTTNATENNSTENYEHDRKQQHRELRTRQRTTAPRTANVTENNSIENNERERELGHRVLRRRHIAYTAARTNATENLTAPRTTNATENFVSTENKRDRELRQHRELRTGQKISIAPRTTNVT
ncbi:chemosensory receptor b [Plakobranchus ocellatus]|uniref:Chemosensory receptor b n=1 Tax=Plakobranchus ocellatus TaxID=259542 RepID=A0AAV4A1E2_9GAST|nr:chemosensory receptor b [Plakobranchus ocellatus]